MSAVWRIVAPWLVPAYYLATPLFGIVDYVTGASLRAAALDGRPLLKTAYYVGCTLLGVMMTLRPRWTRGLSLTESSFNILLLIVGLLGPYYRAVDQLASQGALSGSPITPSAATNFAVAAAVWVISFYRNPLVRG